MLLVFTWSLQNQMRNTHWVVIVLETHLLYFPNLSFLDLNNNLVIRILRSLVLQTDGKFLHQSVHPLQAKFWVLLHGVYRFFHIEATFLHYHQPSHHELPLYSCHTESPRVLRPLSLHRASPKTGIFSFPCQATCISPCQGGKLLLNTKVWLPILHF